jgi:hypothetical protein
VKDLDHIRNVDLDLENLNGTTKTNIKLNEMSNQKTQNTPNHANVNVHKIERKNKPKDPETDNSITQEKETGNATGAGTTTTTKPTTTPQNLTSGPMKSPCPLFWARRGEGSDRDPP